MEKAGTVLDIVEPLRGQCVKSVGTVQVLCEDSAGTVRGHGGNSFGTVWGQCNECGDYAGTL